MRKNNVHGVQLSWAQVNWFGSVGVFYNWKDDLINTTRTMTSCRCECSLEPVNMQDKSGKSTPTDVFDPVNQNKTQDDQTVDNFPIMVLDCIKVSIDWDLDQYKLSDETIWFKSCEIDFMIPSSTSTSSILILMLLFLRFKRKRDSQSFKVVALNVTINKTIHSTFCPLCDSSPDLNLILFLIPLLQKHWNKTSQPCWALKAPPSTTRPAFRQLQASHGPVYGPISDEATP